MKILLDTTYLLPSIKVNVGSIDTHLIRNFVSRKDLSLHYCHISLFELAAKATKLALTDDELKIDDITRGIDSLKHSSKIKEISWYSNPFILELAKTLRSIHSDYIDCLILATAVYTTDVFATYDQTLYSKINSHQSVLREILAININFKFWFSDLSQNWFCLTDTDT